MKEAAERVARDLRRSASKRIYGVDKDQPPIAMSQSQEVMKDTSLEEVLSVLNSNLLIKLGIRPRWTGRHVNPSEFSADIQESLRNYPELMNDFVFHPHLTTQEKLGIKV